MPIIDAYLAELDHEAATTRRVLDRFPDGTGDWRPHPRSMTLGRLAGHVAEMPTWGTVVLTTDELDFATAGEKGYQAFAATGRDEVVEHFDREVARLREAARGVDDERMRQPWTLRNGDETIFTLPRVASLRTFVFSHLIHHRGQLSVYLRLLEVPVPSIYGPSADEERRR